MFPQCLNNLVRRRHEVRLGPLTCCFRDGKGVVRHRRPLIPAPLPPLHRFCRHGDLSHFLPITSLFSFVRSTVVTSGLCALEQKECSLRLFRLDRVHQRNCEIRGLLEDGLVLLYGVRVVGVWSRESLRGNVGA